MRYTTRPLSDQTWLRPASARIASRFDTTWTKTQQVLEREIEHLSGRDVVIEMATAYAEAAERLAATLD